LNELNFNNNNVTNLNEISTNQVNLNKLIPNVPFNQQNIAYNMTNNINNNFPQQPNLHILNNNLMNFKNSNNLNIINNQMKLGNDYKKNKNLNMMGINQMNNDINVQNRNRFKKSNIPIDQYIPMNIDMNMNNYNTNIFPQQQHFLNQNNFYNSNNYIDMNNNMMSNNVPNQNMYR